MMTLILQNEHAAVTIPEWVTDLDSFRRWAQSDEFPEVGWYSHLGGALWMDGSMETVNHNQLKTEIVIVLGSLIKSTGSGRLFSDRMLLTNVEAELSTEPDAMFISTASIQDGRVRLQKLGKSMEVLGSPDLVLEIVSRSSRQKDTATLRELYFAANVREYWLIEQRNEQAELAILTRGGDAFVSGASADGWIRSEVFGKEFRLRSAIDAMGLSSYSLEFR